MQAAAGNKRRATELYGWNARISAALLLPMHFAEITGRNVVHDALTEVYGPRWPWNPTFRGSLPSPPRGYNARQNLEQTARYQGSTGKVITELKFVFWQTMFTASNHVRIWDQRIAQLLPNAGAVAGTSSEVALRERIYADLDAIRDVRNRVAHHEPIHARSLDADLQRMLDLIDLRCTATGSWVRNMEDVTSLLPHKP